MSNVNEKLDNLNHIQSVVFQSKWPKNLVELRDVVSNSLKSDGITDPKITEKVITSISFVCGGRGLYLPSGLVLKTFLRNISIYEDFNGRNMSELATRYQLSERRVHQILKEIRGLYKEARDCEAASHKSK